MSEPKIYQLADLAQDAQTKIQENYENINPIVGVITSMRSPEFPADAITIDCLASGKRIVVILHDHSPDEVAYQFGYREKESDIEVKKMPVDEVTTVQIYSWIEAYFS